MLTKATASGLSVTIGREVIKYFNTKDTKAQSKTQGKAPCCAIR